MCYKYFSILYPGMFSNPVFVKQNIYTVLTFTFICIFHFFPMLPIYYLDFIWKRIMKSFFSSDIVSHSRLYIKQMMLRAFFSDWKASLFGLSGYDVYFGPITETKYSFLVGYTSWWSEQEFGVIQPII